MPWRWTPSIRGFPGLRRKYHLVSGTRARSLSPSVYGQRESYVKLRSIVMGIHHVTPIYSNICNLNQPIETRNHRWSTVPFFVFKGPGLRTFVVPKREGEGQVGWRLRLGIRLDLYASNLWRTCAQKRVRMESKPVVQVSPLVWLELEHVLCLVNWICSLRPFYFFALYPKHRNL